MSKSVTWFLVAVIVRTDLLINYNSFCNIEGYSPIHFYGKVNVRDALPVIWYIIKHFRRCIVHDDVAFTFVLSRSKNQVFYDITWYMHNLLRDAVNWYEICPKSIFALLLILYVRIMDLPIRMWLLYFIWKQSSVIASLTTRVIMLSNGN